MKKVFAVAAAFLILTGCGQPEQGSSSLPQDVPGSALSTESLNCRILYRMEESLLLVQEEEHMATEDLILLTPAGIEISDEQGNPLSHLSWKLERPFGSNMTDRCWKLIPAS